MTEVIRQWLVPPRGKVDLLLWEARWSIAITALMGLALAVYIGVAIVRELA